MSGPLVVGTPLGWVAADGGGWTDEVYATEAEARAAVGVGFDPFTIPGYRELEDDFQKAWESLQRLAVTVADTIVGIYKTDDPEWTEQLFEKYRAANKEFIRARDIRDDCWEAYAGDYKY
jgi:hypothetical protein